MILDKSSRQNPKEFYNITLKAFKGSNAGYFKVDESLHLLFYAKMHDKWENFFKI